MLIETALISIFGGALPLTAWWESALGPVVAALLAGLFAAIIVPRAQRQQQAIQQQQDHEREQQRREDDRTRETAQRFADLERDDRRAKSELSVEMFRLSFGFYVLVEDAARARQYSEPEPPNAVLDDAFAVFKTDGRVIECRLRVAEEMAEIRWLWHAIMDLLSIRFFTVRHSAQRIADLLNGQSREHAATRSIEDDYASEGDQEIREAVLFKYLRDTDIAHHDKVRANFGAALDQLIKATALANRKVVETANQR